MAKNIEYLCSNCNERFPKWSGQCPSCKEWNTLEETEKAPKMKSSSPLGSGRGATKINTTFDITPSYKLKDITYTEENRFKTGLSEVDRVFGGGIVEDSVSIISAPPGAGKSTICLQIANAYMEKGKVALYASSEESISQIKSRASRLNLSKAGELNVISTTSMNSVLAAIEKHKPDFCVVDSINAFYIEEFLPSRAGNEIQITECATAMIKVAKDENHPCAIILIGQMTKEDELAGSRALEHAVDAYFKLDGDRDESLRFLSPQKNRFGSTEETGFFNMTSVGLEMIDNPSEYFLIERPNPVSGTAITVLREGSRPIIVEIDALTSRSFSQYPMRIADSLRKDKVNILMSILEQKANITLFDTNVIISAAGGIKLSDPSTSLAILIATVSSKMDKIVNDDVAFLADVTLTGELRKLPDAERCIKELNRMGFKEVYVANGQKIDEKDLDIKIKRFHTILDVIKEVFK